MLQRLSDRVNLATIVLCVAVFVAMLVISGSGIVASFVLRDPLTWNFPLLRAILPWLAMLSIPVAFKSGEHIAMETLVNALPVAAQRAACILQRLLVLAFALGLLWYGARLFAGATQLIMISATLQLPRWLTAASVPLTGAILLVHAIAALASPLPADRGRAEPA